MDPAALDQLCSRLRSMIRREEIRPGDRLGDERTVAASLGIPRTQLRAALERLEGDGLIRRRIGRGGGIVVSDGRLERNLNTIDSLPDITRAQGVSLDTRVLRAEIASATLQDQRILGVAEDAKVFRVLRLRVTGGRPLSLELSHIPADLFPGLLQRDLGSLYRAMREGYGVTPDYSDETLEISFADDAQAEHLATAPGAALVHIHRVTTGSTGRVIEIGREDFVGDRMRFHLRKYGHVRHHGSG
ncbi:MAG: GntR family transcriptional regulator [Cellulomonadaceae bacterium]